MAKKDKSNEEENIPETEIVEDNIGDEEENIPETEIVEEEPKEEESLTDQLIRLQADLQTSETEPKEKSTYQRANEIYY